ncbi:MAG: TolC family protein [Haliscomenobacteraceae bacterium CHB4]|nr:TolC family protein [Haliscomenobacteraceae bacterium CHB4]
MLKSYHSSRFRLSKFLKLGKSGHGLGFMLLLTSGLSAQNTLGAALSQIEINNPTLRTERQRVEAAAKEYQTGIWLYDPQISYDWLKGFPNSAGNQNDLTVTQPFDYPAAYSRRRKLADLKIGQLAFESQSLRQDILLEAKRIGIQLIYLNKRRAELTRRLRDAEQFLANYQKKYDARDATALDLNKARHQVVNLKTELKLLEAEASERLTSLAALNGGAAVAVTDTIYPAVAALPVFDSLAQTIASSDPGLQFLQAQQQVGAAQVSLTKALNLPKMEAGYRYQGILGQNFHGLHLGLSVPLWENKNRLAQQQLQSAYYAGQLESRRSERFHDVKRLYEKYQNLQAGLDEYRQSLLSLNNMELLDKALQAGQITTLEYFVEQSLLYESRDRLLELEQASALAAAELFKFSL